MASLYFHIPFCKRLCGYCDFYRSVKLRYIPEVVDAMHEELRVESDFLCDRTIRTIYFGGDRALRTCIDLPMETEVLTYQGYKVVIPPYTSKEKPCIRLVRNGSYYVEMGDSEKGVLRRIDFFLDNLDRHFEKLNKGLMNLMDRETALDEELKRSVSYVEMIEACKERLEKLDKELGVA